MDVSKLQPFSDYVGRTVALNRPMILVKEGRGILGYSDVPRVHASPYVILETNGCADAIEAVGRKEYESFNRSNPRPSDAFATKGTPIELPAGQWVTITKVSDDVVWDGEEIIAYGKVKPPQFAHEVTFAYGWSTSYLLAPAPWEPATTPPARRNVRTQPFSISSIRVSRDTPTWGEPAAEK
ncbi:MAG TPA: hypothetical protein VH597_14575 [Verrucomicrobiae bacterium]|jgi:hypothetical protein|nr:hypothetical protein [Verrucomicrobiae bacterium]